MTPAWTGACAPPIRSRASCPMTRPPSWFAGSRRTWWVTAPGRCRRAVGDDRRTTLALLAAALLCLAVGSPGIAQRLAAWTGIHGSGFGEEDTSEYLLSTAPDYRQAVESLRPAHLPLPPGYDWRKAVDLFTALDMREPTYVPATSIKDNYAGYAACAWEAEWLAGRRTGDTGRVRGATEVLAEARSWPDAGADKTGGARRARDQIATAAANGVPARSAKTSSKGVPDEWQLYAVELAER
jgi:hypothetical protein